MSQRRGYRLKWARGAALLLWAGACCAAALGEAAAAPGQASPAPGQVAGAAGPAASTQPATRPADYLAVALPPAKSLPSSPGYFVMKVRVSSGQRDFPMTVGLFLPPAYFKRTDSLPVVVTLHNVGVKGLGGGGLTSEGLASLWVQDEPDYRASATTKPATQPIKSLRQEAEFVGITPQCPRDMAFEQAPMGAIISELITQLAKVYRLDEQRLYLTGFSYGGTCTLQIAQQMPLRYAAIAAISPRASNTPRKAAVALKQVPVYLACGTEEWATPLCRQLNEGLTITKHPDFTYREIQGGSHWCYPYIYKDPGFWKWLFSHRRSEAKATGTASAGGAKNAAH